MKFITLLLTILLGALPISAGAAGLSNEPTITVNAQGSVLRTPDDAVVYATLTNTNDSATAAMSANNAAYDTLHSRLTGLGIPDATIKTQSFNVNFVPHPQSNSATPPPYYQPRFGYTVTRSLFIDAGSRDLAAKAVDAASAAQASNINVRFVLKNQREAYMTALTEAMRDAQAQATTMASAAGLRIISLRSAQAGSVYYSQPLPMMRNALAMPAPAPPTDLSQPGDVEVRASVTVTYIVGR